MDRIGLPGIIHSSGLPEHEVTSLYFEFSSVCRVLPDDPDAVPEPLWEYLSHCLQLISTLVHLADKEEVERARQNAVRKFLPQARTAVEHEYQEQRQEGTIEFRLGALVRGESSAEQSRALCREALRLEREARYQACAGMSAAGLDQSRAVIVECALTYAHRSVADAPEHFAPVDLVVRLLDLLHSIRQQVPQDDAPSGDVDRIILGLGNVLFSDELGL